MTVIFCKQYRKIVRTSHLLYNVGTTSTFISLFSPCFETVDPDIFEGYFCAMMLAFTTNNKAMIYHFDVIACTRNRVIV